MHTDPTTLAQQPDPAVETIASTPAAALDWHAAGYTERTEQGRVALYRHKADGTPDLTDPAYVEHIAQAGPLVLLVVRQTYTEPDPDEIPPDYSPLLGVVLASAELAHYPLLADLLNPPSSPATPIWQTGKRRRRAA